MILDKMSELFSKTFYENVKHQIGRLKRMMRPYWVYHENDILKMCLTQLVPRHISKAFESGYIDVHADLNNITIEDKYTWNPGE